MHNFFLLLKLIQNRDISAGAWMNVVNPDLYYFFLFSTFLYLSFAVVLGGTCTRSVLQTDYMISEKVQL